MWLSELFGILIGIAAKSLTVQLIVLASGDTKTVLDVGGIPYVQRQSMGSAIALDQPVIHARILHY